MHAPHYYLYLQIVIICAHYYLRLQVVRSVNRRRFAHEALGMRRSDIRRSDIRRLIIFAYRYGACRYAPIDYLHDDESS